MDGRLKSAPRKSDAVIYCRVSTKEQLQNLSLPVQERVCRAYCERNNWNVAQVFKEAESAKTVNRTEFQAMLEYCFRHDKTVAAVVCYDASRFSRETADYHHTRGLLKLKGIVIRAATQPFDESPAGELTETILAAFATFDNRMRTEKTVAGMKAAQQAGRWVHRPPLGYMSVPGARSTEANLILDPERAPLLRKAFELYASGQYSKADVLTDVTILGLKDASGRSISPQTFDKLLRNPVYMGWITTSWGIATRGLFEPIVTEEIFTAVQNTLFKRGLQPTCRTLRSADFPLRVFARCAHCNTPLTGSFSTGRAGTRYPYYSCRDRGCKRTRRKRDDVHADFIVLLNGLQLKPEFSALLRQILVSVHEQKDTLERNRVGIARKRIAEVQNRKQKIVDAMLDGKITQQIYVEQMERVDTELGDLQATIDDAALIEPQALERMLDFADWFFQNAGAVWLGADLENKIRIQEAVFPSGVSLTSDGFGTVQPANLFSNLWAEIITENGLASPRGFEPLLSP
jgi:site-specific DNA recombinase